MNTRTPVAISCEQAEPVCSLVYTIVRDHPDGITYSDLMTQMTQRGCDIDHLTERVHYSLNCMVCNGKCDKLESEILARIHNCPAQE